MADESVGVGGVPDVPGVSASAPPSPRIYRTKRHIGVEDVAEEEGTSVLEMEGRAFGVGEQLATTRITRAKTHTIS